MNQLKPLHWVVVGFICGVLVAGVGFWQWQRASTPYLATADSQVSAPVSEISQGVTSEKTGKEIMIHLAGAIRNPGLLKISATARLGEAVEKAGGAIEQADLNQLNLAIILEDGARYYIPTKGESNQHTTSDTVVKSTDKDKLDLNSAELNDLTKLPQIGESRAKAILEYRKKQGRFHSTDEIMKVPGIGEGIYAVIRDQITVR